MNVRSRSLAAVGLLLLTGAAALGAVLAREGDAVPAAELADAQPGDHVEVKGTPEAFYPTSPLAAWHDVWPLLGNLTYALETEDVVALLTGDIAAPDGLSVAQGLVEWSGEHPAGDGRTLVIVRVTAWREPLLR